MNSWPMRACRRHIWECDEAQRNTSGWHIRVPWRAACSEELLVTSKGQAKPEGNHLARTGLVTRPVGREVQEVYHERRSSAVRYQKGARPLI